MDELPHSRELRKDFIRAACKAQDGVLSTALIPSGKDEVTLLDEHMTRVVVHAGHQLRAVGEFCPDWSRVLGEG